MQAGEEVLNFGPWTWRIEQCYNQPDGCRRIGMSRKIAMIGAAKTVDVPHDPALAINKHFATLIGQQTE